ncbi:MAG: pilus assembly protein PilM [Microgenomates group bacterium]
MDRETNFFSLDIGLNYFKLAYAAFNKDQIELKNLGLIFFPYNIYSTDNQEIVQEASQTIQKLIKEANINIKNVNIIIPNSVSFTQVIPMPYLNEKELISAIKYQADKFIPLPIEETNVDLEILEENKNQKTILALIVAAPKKVIEKVKEIVEVTGLIPESIENETTAVSRFFTQTRLANLAFDFNFDDSTFYYFDKENFLLREIYNFKIGYIHFREEIQINTNLKLNQCEEILENYLVGTKTTVAVEEIISPLIEELFIEFKKFFTLITGKYKEQISNVCIFNHVVKFPALTNLLNKKIPNFFNILDLKNQIKKNSVFDANKHHIPFFVAPIGANL